MQAEGNSGAEFVGIAESMIFTDAQRYRLLGAIETDSLMFLCGAGLSMPAPSNLLSAAGISQRCYDRWVSIEPLDLSLRNDIEQFANHFHERGDFQHFLGLIPWNELVGDPNKGHAAIADLLITRGVRAALSANIDCLVEHWAQGKKIDMRGALNGKEASDSITTNPLLKFHGCLREKENTVWTHRQIDQSPVRERIKSCSDWMKWNLQEKDLVVVGFWTDWLYLNDVFANAFGDGNAKSVTVIDRSPSSVLQAKAPILWEKLSGLSCQFDPVQASADEALDELRTAYSRAWANKFYKLGLPSIEASNEVIPPTARSEDMLGEDLYNLRRDAEGIPYNKAATWKTPGQPAAQAAYMHMILLNAGATKQGAWLQFGGQSIRIVNGAGWLLGKMKEEYKEPTPIEQPDIVICADAKDYGVPGKIIASGRGASMIRPSPGGGTRWLTFEQARSELNV